MENKIVDKIKEIVPNSPGCYLYYDKDDVIIYVGKAKRLKKRMLSYFNRKNNIKTEFLVSKIKTFDYLVTINENEALILENNLIKKHTPYYNIALKDDKTYPYIRVTGDKHPRIVRTRTRNLSGVYYGPYPSGSFVMDIIYYLNKNVPLRKCANIPKKECIYFHIQQCYAPCINEVDEKQVKQYREQVDKYLKNDMKNLEKKMQEDMFHFADNLQFEEAQKYKNILDSIKQLRSEQYVQFSKDIEIDVIDFYNDDNFISLSIVEVRGGKVLNIHRVMIPFYDNISDEIFSYLYDYYAVKKPKNIVTEHKELETMITEILLINKKSANFKEFKQISEIARENAREYYQKNINRITTEYFEKENDGFKKLQEITGDSLKRIEIYDISHLFGDSQVGSMVVYENGKKNPKQYRKYKIKEKSNLKNDYGSIKEVLTRRLARAIKEDKFPNLIIVDGGKGQVSSALEVLCLYGLDKKIKLIGLAKDDKHKTKAIVNKKLQEKNIDRKSVLYKFLYDIQEEVHRYAIDFHHKLQINSLFKSELDKIDGLGPKRKKILMEHFEYLDNIKNASYDDLKKLKLPSAVIDNITNAFKK